MGLVDDMNDNLVPDECECLGDSNLDGKIDIDDLLKLLGYWGTCSDCPDVDLNGDDKVDIEDLLILLATWGDCPTTSACGLDEIEDCFGNCAPADWLGDGFCDDGSDIYNGNFIFLNCEAYDWDGGDCDP